MSEQLGLLQCEEPAPYGSPASSRVCVIIRIPGEPFAQPRQRHRLVRTNAGREFIHNFQPQGAINWKAYASGLMKIAMVERGLSPFTGGVRMEIVCRFSCPRSEWRTRSPRPERWSMSAKDCDNLAKAACDSGNGVLYLDDHQVVDLRVLKRVAAQGAPPEVIVTVEAIEEGR